MCDLPFLCYIQVNLKCSTILMESKLRKCVHIISLPKDTDTNCLLHLKKVSKSDFMEVTFVSDGGWISAENSGRQCGGAHPHLSGKGVKSVTTVHCSTIGGLLPLGSNAPRACTEVTRGTSRVVQWLRICLVTQETWVRYLVWKIPWGN